VSEICVIFFPPPPFSTALCAEVASPPFPLSRRRIRTLCIFSFFFFSFNHWQCRKSLSTPFAKDILERITFVPSFFLFFPHFSRAPCYCFFSALSAFANAKGLVPLFFFPFRPSPTPSPLFLPFFLNSARASSDSGGKAQKICSFPPPPQVPGRTSSLFPPFFIILRSAPSRSPSLLSG